MRNAAIALLALTRCLPIYADWRRENVQVPRGRCHVVTARLLVRLQPAG